MSEIEESNLIPWQPGIGDEDHSVLAVWPGCLVEPDDIEKLEEFLVEVLGATRPILIVGTVNTLPTPGNEADEPGGRSDFFFYFHDEDIMVVAVPRLQYGIRWWEDIYFNDGQDIYPADFREAYPKP